MNDLRCPVCKKLRLGPEHTCDPVWECTSEDPRGEKGEFEGSRIRASSADDAAERYVLESVSSGDWAGENEVYVRKVGTDVVNKFVVEIELAPSTSSTIVESFEIETCEVCGKMAERASMELHDELGLHCRDCQLKHGTLPEPQAELEC